MSLQVDQIAVSLVSSMSLNQDDKAVVSSGLAVGRSWFAAILVVVSLTANAQNVINESTINTAGQSDDKSAYSLFNPTPTALMRELNADRPDKTDCPFTVDAGHFQVEMDFANLTNNPSNPDRGSVRFTAFEFSPMNLKVGVLNNLDFQTVGRKRTTATRSALNTSQVSMASLHDSK